MALNPIGKLLGSSAELKSLSARARRQRELQDAFVRSAPGARAAAARVKTLKSGTLVISASNAATAAKLRQLAPTLVAKMRALEPEIAALKIEVQISAPAQPGTELKHTLGSDAVAQFDALADAMPEGNLKAAVSRLVRHHRRNR